MESARKQRATCRFGTYLLPALLMAGFLSSCLYPREEDSELAKSSVAADAARAFFHKDHEHILKKERFLCTDCHLYDLAYMEKDKLINDAITRALTRAGIQSCHYCHVENPDRIEKTLKCLDCHRDIRPIRPEDHMAGWKSSHGMRITLAKRECTQCHSNRFCIQCHTRRDEASRSFHTGSAVVTHPVEARVDPSRCQSCHQPAYCLRCHRFGRF